MEENPKNDIHCIAISRNMLERILRIHYSDVCSIWVDKKSRYKRFDTINQKHPLCPGWQRFISLISVSSVLVTSSSRHRCVWFYKIGHTWTYCTIHYKRKWRGTFRSLIKISIYFGIDHPLPPPDHTTVGVCFLGGLSGLCILGDPGAVNQAARKGPLKYFRRNFSPDPTNCNWVFEDEVID